MLAGDIVEKLKNRFDAVEVYIEKTVSKEFELRNSKDFSKGMNIDKGCGIRAIDNGKLAFIHFSMSNDEKLDIDKISRELSESAFLVEKIDANSISKIPFKSQRNKEFDINDILAKEKIEFMDNIAKSFDKRIVDVKGASVGFFKKEFEIANSYGVSAKDEKTHVSASVSVLAKENEVSDSGWYSLDGDSLDSIDFEFVAQKAANMAVNKLHPKTASTKKYSIIFANYVFNQILSHFFSAFDGYSVINHTTPFANKIGERIFSDNITIKDAKSLSFRPNDTLIDDEGSKRQDTVVVEKGVLKTFLHNTYTSEKLNQNNTANAKRASWASLPKVGAFNFYIEGDAAVNRDELLNKFDGIYITEIMGLHMANSISGDFSFGIDGFLTHNGELVSYFKSATLADNFFDMMKRVIGLSNSMYFSGSFGSPDIAIADCVVGGEGYE